MVRRDLYYSNYVVLIRNYSYIFLIAFISININRAINRLFFIIRSYILLNICLNALIIEGKKISFTLRIIFVVFKKTIFFVFFNEFYLAELKLHFSSMFLLKKILFRISLLILQSTYVMF